MILIVDDFIAGGYLYSTRLQHYSDGDYGIHQEAHEGAPEDSVYLNREQAIVFARAILKNEGIHATD